MDLVTKIEKKTKESFMWKILNACDKNISDLFHYEAWKCFYYKNLFEAWGTNKMLCFVGFFYYFYKYHVRALEYLYKFCNCEVAVFIFVIIWSLCRFLKGLVFVWCQFDFNGVKMKQLNLCSLDPAPWFNFNKVIWNDCKMYGKL